MNGYIKRNILSVTPNPREINDILLKADHIGRKSNKEAVKVDVVTLLRKDQQVKTYPNSLGRFTKDM